MQESLPADDLVLSDPDDPILIFGGITHTIDTAHARYYNNISSAAEQLCRCLQPKLIQLFIYAQIFFYISIAAGYVSLGLVIIIIGNKIAHSIVREKLLELPYNCATRVLLCVITKSRPLNILDHIGHGKCLTAACYAQQDLVLLPFQDAFGELCNGVGLIACRRIG
jgi:hypothetical protein